MTIVAYAIFDTQRRAAKAVDALVESNFTTQDLCVLYRDGPEGSGIAELPVDVKTSIGPGMVIGAILGVVGGVFVALGWSLFATSPLVTLLQG